MFNIGGPEVLVIALVALIVVGPDQLPSVLRKAGQYASQARSMTAGLRQEFMAGVDEIDPTKWSEDAEKNNGTASSSSGPLDPDTKAATNPNPIVPRGYAERVAANDPDNPFSVKPVSGTVPQRPMAEPTPEEAAAEAAAAAEKAERAAQEARAEANRARAKAKAAQAAEAAEAAAAAPENGDASATQDAPASGESEPSA